jgi:putative FmdB family regulatory protein
MPFYEYECSACKHQTEVLQKISDAPLKKCPECGKQALKRLISAPVFRLKGGGWYETDFKSDNETKRNLVGKEEAAESKSEDKTEAKSDAKAAESKPADSKPEAKPAEIKSSPAKKSSAAKPVAAKPVKPAKRSATKTAAKKKAARR